MRYQKKRTEEITLTINLNDVQAWQYAQFLKRIRLDDYEQRATSQQEAYTMFEAGERIREALRQKGFAPR